MLLIDLCVDMLSVVGRGVTIGCMGYLYQEQKEAKPKYWFLVIGTGKIEIISKGLDTLITVD